MVAVNIERKIVGFEVVKPDEQNLQVVPVTAPEVLLQRGDVLQGATSKIKPAGSDTALYITINDIVKDDGSTVPFEIFINSKNMEHFQWVVALTRLISAVFRKGGDITFLVEELSSVFDPKGGYYLKGKYYSSVVAHIGYVIQKHLEEIGLLGERLDEATAAFIASKRQEYETRKGADKEPSFPPESVLCGKCSTKAVIKLDGCMTCLSCGDSKCG